MTFQLVTRYCFKCHTGTPHEVDEDTGRCRCVPCAEKHVTQPIAYAEKPKGIHVVREQDTASHIAALDGHGNRGEEKRNRK